jgi:D-galactose 1-dehydrogenase
MGRHRIGVIGLGKIAQDQHLPVIAASDAFTLAAVSSQRGLSAGEALSFRDAASLLAGTPDLHAVAICTPPQVRYDIAVAALRAGKHVMLEKPPTATLAELAALEAEAARRGLVLMTTWHSQYNAAVDAARDLLAGRIVTELFVNWKEDVRKWHPGQAWIWRAGGFGVFDPGINALSIVTKIMPGPVFVAEAELLVPANVDAPIAATIRFAGAGDLRAEFDWRATGGETWEIAVATRDGPRLALSGGGARLAVDGVPTVAAQPLEYQAIYRHFAELLDSGRSHVDAAPFRLVADAFMLGRRVASEVFQE